MNGHSASIGGSPLTDDGGGELFPASHPVVATLANEDGGRAWWDRLPSLVAEFRKRWALELAAPYAGGSCSWVAPVNLRGGDQAVLKISFPHREAAGEAAALRAWDGRGAVHLLDHDEDKFAMLIERCLPGLPLSQADHIDPKQRLEIGAGLLRELWSAPVDGVADLERLADVTAEWAALVEERMERFQPSLDPGLVRHGARLLRELPVNAPRSVLLHGDFNPGNILTAQRRPWLVIDAKPMIGDPAYDPWPLIEQVDDPFAHPEPLRVLTERFGVVADQLSLESARLGAWAVARRVETALWLVARGRSGDASGVMAEASKLANLASL